MDAQPWIVRAYDDDSRKPVSCHHNNAQKYLFFWTTERKF
jgi:hypothetical protein